MAAEFKLYPNANVEILGGCCISDDSPSREPVMYCRACRRALREHRTGRVR